MKQKIIKIKPQAGPQETFLSTSADIALYGGAAGGGKTFALLFEPIRHIRNPNFGTVIFRRESPQITNEGGLWDESMKLYPHLGAEPLSHKLTYKFPSGAKLKFSHLQYDSDVLNWQGSQIPLLCCTPDTLIKMSDGTKKKLSEIRIGDRLLTLNGEGLVTAVGKEKTVECVECEDENGYKQINSSNHKILTINGWVSYDDIVCESLLSRDMGLSKSQSFFHKFSLLFGKKLQFLKQYLLRSYSHQSHILIFLKSQLDRLSLSEIFSYKALIDQENDFGLFRYGNLKFLRHALIHLLLMLVLPILLLKVYIFHSFLALYVALNALILKVFEGLISRYLSYNHQCGGLAGVSEDSNLSASLILNGVVRQNQKDLPLDDLGIIRKDILHELQYIHPYTFEEQIAEEEVYLSSIKITPCGKKNVIDITVSNQCHYITDVGLVNKNCFDELTHFSKSQFFYMMSRNRSTCGVRPYIRATTNPDADSWVAEFISWWIDQNTGLAIPERSGVIRWFINLNNEIIWADSKKDLQDKYDGCMPKSFTFIVASIYDNKILLKKDPGYLANLMALPLVDRERLLGGNWKIRPSSGLYFKREYFQIIDAAPADCEWWRSWDLAATEKTHDNDPDWTVGVKIGRDKQGVFYIGDVIRFQKSPLHVEQAIMNIAAQDGSKVRIALSQDPGQAGKAHAEYLTRKLAGYMVFTERETGDKVTRAGAFSSQCEAGNVKIVRGTWNSNYLMELENFPPEKNKGHDDQVDASANGFNRIAKPAQHVRIRTA